MAALDRAREAAGGREVRLGGGAGTLRDYLRLGPADELHVVISPVLLGSGERLFDGLDALPDAYTVAELVASRAAVHARIVRRT